MFLPVDVEKFKPIYLMSNLNIPVSILKGNSRAFISSFTLFSIKICNLLDLSACLYKSSYSE